MLKKALLYLFCGLALTSIAQSRKRTFRQREIGFLAGGSYYIGDLNPRNHFKATHPAAGLFFRYTTNYRYAFRFGFNYGSISGDDSKSSEPDQVERNLKFRSKLYELSAIAEFNFVEYRIGNDKHPFTLFIFAGLAGFYFNPEANIGNGYQSLPGEKTEGQGSSYPKMQISIPFGLGLKWNIGDHCGLGVEWGPRRTFTDYLDDVKGTYPLTASEGNNYTNQSINGGATAGTMRGNPSTRDWYFYYGVTLSIKLRDPHQTCHGRGIKIRSRHSLYNG